MLDKYVVFLRLGSIVSCGLSTWFMFKCVSTISTERAGWFAACLYNASFYAAITAGFFIFPDAPQMVFYTFSLWMIARITLHEVNWINWILLGIGTGLCIMSKVHGVFIWIGLGLYILFLKRSWLVNPRMYISLAIALIITSPILIWNIHYDFLTYRFNSERIAVKGFSHNWYSFLTDLAGQFFINNPFNVAFIYVSLIALLRHKIKREAALSIYNFTGVSLIVILLYISFYRSTLPHWSGPAYVALIPLAAIRLSQVTKEKFYPKLICLSLGAYTIFMIICPALINYYPGTFGSKITIEQGKGDLTLDMYGWSKAAKSFDSLYRNERARGVMPKNSPVVCNKWWGAHVEYYFCRPLGIQMIGLGEINQLHEYMWMNNLRKNKVDFSAAYCIINSDDYYDVHEQYNNYYNQIDTIQIIQIPRNNKPSHNFYVFRLTEFKNNLPILK